ncbi:HAMP domain-containing sensor histidine kinase [Clostridium sp. ATCC 25772]|uniref:sensor histidine kinase n=1 Tax=Clostridium sp. ATCC 25772 TaxID=1676991 RepID=UPI0007850931|nr:HAMP domain-containing sensor histidine kinase [Clostridium sp. ATCC 25772]
MSKILKNPEVKKILTLFLIVFLIATVFATIMSIYFCNAMKKEVINYKSALVGAISDKYPMEKETIVRLTISDNKKDKIHVLKGTSLLKQYGYYNDMNFENEPIVKHTFKNYMFFTMALIFTIFMLFLIIIIIILKIYYKEIYLGINFTESIIKGNYNYNLDSYSDGDIGILKSNIVKMTSILKEHLDKEKRIKVFLSDTMADISHQLKTPMTSLIMFNELMINPKMDWNIRKEFLENSEIQLKRMEWLIKSLLKLSRLDAGVVKFKKEKINIKNLISEVKSSLWSFIKEKNIEIILNGNEDSYYIGDTQWSIEAFTNIMKNSVEHTPKDGTIIINYEENNLYSEIKIKDNGIGISKKDLHNIFRRFYKSSNINKSDSVGIGLALSKTIIENQNGSIYVKSHEGKGAEFIISFLK